MMIEQALLCEYFNTFPQQSIAHLSKSDGPTISKIVGDLPIETLCSVIMRLPLEQAGVALIGLSAPKFLQVYASLDPVRSSRILLEVDPKDRQDKIKLLTVADQKDLIELESYPSDSAGALMHMSPQLCRTTDFVADVIQELRQNKAHSREIYVTDIENKLVGHLPVQDLLYSDDKEEIAKIMHGSPPSINALSPKSEVLELFETYKLSMLPVTHIDGTLIGGIRYSILIEEVQNKALSTMASLGGASPSERALSPPYFPSGKDYPGSS